MGHYTTSLQELSKPFRTYKLENRRREKSPRQKIEVWVKTIFLVDQNQPGIIQELLILGHYSPEYPKVTHLRANVPQVPKNGEKCTRVFFKGHRRPTFCSEEPILRHTSLGYPILGQYGQEPPSYNSSSLSLMTSISSCFLLTRRVIAALSLDFAFSFCLFRPASSA